MLNAIVLINKFLNFLDSEIPDYAMNVDQYYEYDGHRRHMVYLLTFLSYK